MSYELIEREIQTRAAGFTTCELVYENDPKLPESAEWLRLAVEEGETRRVALGPSPLLRATGVVSARVSVPEMSGSRRLRQIADAFTTLFQDWTSPAGVRLGVPTLRRLEGVRAGRGRSGLEVRIPYDYDFFG
jgi:hypothetical protein